MKNEEDIQSDFCVTKVEHNGETGTIYLRMTINGEQTEFSLQRQCESARWVSDKGRLSGKSEDVKSINAYLDAVQLKIYDIFQTFISTGIDFDGEKIKARYLGFDVEKPRMFLEVYEEHNKELKRLSAKAYPTARCRSTKQSKRM